jgi:hypothetical protein
LDVIGQINTQQYKIYKDTVSANITKAAKWGVASQVALGDVVQYCQCSVAGVQHMHSAAAAIEGERGTVGGLGRRLQ